jgi:hypothetical protein
MWKRIRIYVILTLVFIIIGIAFGAAEYYGLINWGTYAAHYFGLDNFIESYFRIYLATIAFLYYIALLDYGLAWSRNNHPYSATLWSLLFVVVSVGYYIAIADSIYRHALRHNRRAVGWFTAFLIFTPLLAGIAYLLTWPRSKR